MSAHLDTSDLHRIERDLDGYERDLTGRGKLVVETFLGQGEAISTALVPFDTGHLLSTLDSSDVDVHHGVIEGEWGAGAHYADFVERGTRHSSADYAPGLLPHQINWRTRPQPYVVPAFEAIEPGFHAAAEAIVAPW